ncbi:MAG TPA: POTRA domain-containing protein, partial [Kofleriaceae bacterium]|nr:POTRA domain-containing protein [Kofleriaceae bacterium]
TGELVDPPETVRALMEPTMHANPNLNDEARKAIADAAAKIGYELVGLTTTQLPDDTTKASVFLAPRPMVRKIDLNVHQGLVDALIDDDIRHHMQLRVGSYLPWKPLDRACARLDEQRNLEDFLRTSGYYDGKVEVTEQLDKGALTLSVDVQLGEEYHVGKITIADTGPLAVTPDQKIKDVFKHTRRCIIATLCYGTLRFTQKQHEEDKKAVVELFHKAGYPAVRVQTDVDYKTSFDRRSKTVPFTIRIDQRRRVDVVFEGNDPDALTDEQLRGQLTFAQAQSADDVEAGDSARAITKYLQGRGYFDAKVTWTRERFAVVDHLVFRIQAGNGREVKKIEFAGANALSPEYLGSLIATQPAKVTLFGDTVAATSAQLADDVGRIKDAYRRAGYRDARIRVSAASDPDGLSSAALAASLVAGGRGDGLYVRFSIDEGAPTKLVGVEIANDDGDLTLAGTPRTDTTKPDHRLTAELCRNALKHLADILGDQTLAQQPKQRCVANARGSDPKRTNGEFREDEVSKTKDQMREWLFNTGRPRAEVDYKAVVIAP